MRAPTTRRTFVKRLTALAVAFQRGYAYVLGQGLDVVNADMQTLADLRENVVAAAASAQYFG
ncbi:MAG TPA: hypothetical protein VNO26_16850 [Candidatus Limnocylindria bacterium]|nr:hypothetical protein [Candidatus Limnocylindria bacterium]